MERIKVRESDTVRFLYLTAFFLEFFLLVYRDDEKRGISHLDDEHGHDFGMVAEMTEPHAIGFVTLRMKTALEEKVRRRSFLLPRVVVLRAGPRLTPLLSPCRRSRPCGPTCTPASSASPRLCVPLGWLSSREPELT